MSSLGASLAAALPAPRYTGQEEELKPQQRGPRIVGPGQIDDTQIVLKHTGPPPYGQRVGWRPRNPEDFGDGGAFPEIPIAQYPLDMGRKNALTSNALAIQVDAEGKVKYDAIARQGHESGRIVHASFKDLIPLRQRADAGELDLSRPSAEAVAETSERTKTALANLVSGAVAAQKPKNVNVQGRRDPTFVKYTPANQMGSSGAPKQDRIMKIVERQRDPMEPPKFKHKKIPRGPPSPPPPVMHSPPRKLTAEDQENWKIPPPVSNWKNPKGFTVPLDKRLAADGRGLADVTINDKFAQLSEALFMADRAAREEVQQRQKMKQRIAEKEREAKEDELRHLAAKAREDRLAAARGRASGRRARSGSASSRSRSSSRSPQPRRRRHRSDSYSSDSRSRSRSDSGDDEGSGSDTSSVRARIAGRRERQRSEERKLRQSRMGAERRMQVLAREQGRDISEKIALGIAKPTQSKEGMYDSRLFDQDSGFHAGINEDNPYDKPLFQAQNALSSIYSNRARAGAGGDDGDGDYDEAAGDKEMNKITKQGGRFGDALGKGVFKGSEVAEKRDGPVQFEKEKQSDPFNVDKFFSEMEQGGGSGAGGSGAGAAVAGGSKRGYGLQEGEGGGGGSDRQNKRARVTDDGHGD
ncbi:hypothetical protein MKZ38_004074 [Zalerion maritima]|uniref:Pre-mRNA-processing protein 45 n=1 Tax=Zalerion maritima TaxID=339359 RepID=A0AAD5RYJ3_9PEZI|nr:hypothetical protein MKZ38_004074 [Zalerion maritima]